jgi:hypothetical protein
MRKARSSRRPDHTWLRLLDGRRRVTVDFADLRMRAIRGEPHQAVAAQTVRLGGRDRAGDRLCVRSARVVREQRAIGKRFDFLQ